MYPTNSFLHVLFLKNLEANMGVCWSLELQSQISEGQAKYLRVEDRFENPGVLHLHFFSSH